MQVTSGFQPPRTATLLAVSRAELAPSHDHTFHLTARQSPLLAPTMAREMSSPSQSKAGEPKRLTFGTNDQCMGWTPDGKVMFATPEGNPYGGRQPQLMLVGASGGIPPAHANQGIRFGPVFRRRKARRVQPFQQLQISIGDAIVVDLKERSQSTTRQPTSTRSCRAKRDQNYHPLVLG